MLLVGRGAIVRVRAGRPRSGVGRRFLFAADSRTLPGVQNPLFCCRGSGELRCVCYGMKLSDSKGGMPPRVRLQVPFT